MGRIDRENGAIVRLCEAMHPGRGGHVANVAALIDNAAAEITRLKDLTTPVLCSERLPEKPGEYLVRIATGKHVVADRCVGGNWFIPQSQTVTYPIAVSATISWLDLSTDPEAL